MTTRNYGFRSRDMFKSARFAILDAIRRREISGDTGNRFLVSFNQFIESIKAVGIRDLNRVSSAHLESFGQQVALRCSQTDASNPLTAKSGRNMISNVNRVLEIMRGDRALYIKPKDFVKTDLLSARICRETNEVAEHAVMERWAALGEMGLRIEAVNNLCIHGALRFEEAIKLNAKAALYQALATGAFLISSGTKGGQTRKLTLLPHFSEDAIKSLRVAALYQGDHHNLIPPELSESQFTNRAYGSIRGIKGFMFHNARHTWARQTYYELTGHDPPVRFQGEKQTFFESMALERGITIEAARALDTAARKYIAESLGHHRIDITAIYLG